MSLNFDVSKVKDYRSVTSHPDDDNRWHPVTETILNIMMVIGLGEITVKNLDEFKRRTRQYQAVVGGLLGTMDGQLFVTDADIDMHVGVSTNVSNKSATQWYAHLADIADRNCDSQYQKATAHDIVNFYSIRREDGSHYVTYRNR